MLYVVELNIIKYADVIGTPVDPADIDSGVSAYPADEPGHKGNIPWLALSGDDWHRIKVLVDAENDVAAGQNAIDILSRVAVVSEDDALLEMKYQPRM